MIKLGRYEMHDSLTGDARDLVQRMIVKDVKMRISVRLLCLARPPDC